MTFEVAINSSAFQATVERQAVPMMERDLTEITTIIGEQADEPKSGPQYRGNRRRSSAPRESPARQTSTLVDSITKPQVGREGGILVGWIRITAPYAILLQRGTNRIKPRPIAEPAVEEFLRRRA